MALVQIAKEQSIITLLSRVATLYGHMKITRLKDHTILKAASAVSREYIAKCKTDNPEQDPSATKRESYAIETLRAIGEVVDCIDQLHLSVDMLSGYKSRRVPNRMNRYDYIVFGIENYYLRLTAVFDRCLRLANATYQLGLPERQCNNDTIIKNSHVKGTPVAKPLKELDKFTEAFRFHRNRVAHQATYSEKDLYPLGAYYLLAEVDDSWKRYHYRYKKQTDDFVTNRKAEFQRNVAKLENLVEAYLDALNAVFETRLKSYVGFPQKFTPQRKR